MDGFILQEEAKCLLTTWYEARGSSSLPSRKFLDPLKLRRWVNDISIVEVREGAKIFYVALHGAHVARHLGSNFNKRYLEDVIPQEALDVALAPYRLSMETYLPCYSTLRLTLQNGLFKSLERMVMPCWTKEPEQVGRFLVWVAPIESGVISSSSVYVPFSESEKDPMMEDQEPEGSADLFVLSEDWCE